MVFLFSVYGMYYFVLLYFSKSLCCISTVLLSLPDACLFSYRRLMDRIRQNIQRWLSDDDHSDCIIQLMLLQARACWNVCLYVTRLQVSKLNYKSNDCRIVYYKWVYFIIQVLDENNLIFIKKERPEVYSFHRRQVHETLRWFLISVLSAAAQLHILHSIIVSRLEFRWFAFSIIFTPIHMITILVLIMNQESW